MKGIATLDESVMDSPIKVIDKLFNYFIASNYSQTAYNYGNIKSLKYIYGKYTSVTEEFLDELEDSIVELYKPIFGNNIEVKYGEVEDHILPIDVSINYENKTYNLSTGFKIDKNNIRLGSQLVIK